MTSIATTVQREQAAYRAGEERPLGSFTALMAGYAATVVGAAALVRRSRRELPERIGAADLALLAVATHKLSRRLAKDPVTSPLRAPFTRFDGTTGPAELKEQVRGSGPRKALGELVTCPFCMAQWIATGFCFGLVVAPRPTRFAASVLTVVSGSDLLQYAHAALDKAVD